jgi:hypothetical protein
MSIRILLDVLGHLWMEAMAKTFCSIERDPGSSFIGQIGEHS